MKTKSEIIYLIAFALYCFMAVSGGSELIILNNTLKIIIYGVIIALLGFKIIVHGLTIKEIMIYMIIGMLCLFTYIKVDTIFFLMNFLIIISVKDVDIKKVVKLDIIIKSIFIFTHIALYGIDYLCAYDKIQGLIINNGNRIRHAFYFAHPNIVSAMIFWIIMDIYYLKENIKSTHVIIGTILMLAIYNFTKSRTILILYFLFLLIFYIGKVIKFRSIYYKIIDITHKFIFEIIALVSIVTSVLYKYNIHLITTVLNALTSGRVYYSYAAINDFGLNLFWNTKAINLEKYLYLDNFFIRCTVLYGLIFVILIAIMPKLVRVRKEEAIKEKIIFIILTISLFSEYFGIIIGNAIPLLLIGNLILNKGKEDENERREENNSNNTNLQS